jgi:hypothetical protein
VNPAGLGEGIGRLCSVLGGLSGVRWFSALGVLGRLWFGGCQPSLVGSLVQRLCGSGVRPWVCYRTSTVPSRSG